MAQAQWPGQRVETHTPPPQAAPAQAGGLVQIVPPQAPQPGGQTQDQAALTAEQLRAARLANDATEGADIPGNVALQGPEYLQSLEPGDQEQVRALSEGRIPWPTGRAASSPHWQRIIAATGHFDPSFDAANYATRVATRRNFTAGRRAQNITSLNTVLHHIEGLRQSADALHNGDYPRLNAIGNWFSNEFGSGNISDFDTAATAVSDELEAALVNSGGTLAGREGWRDLMSSSSSPEQFDRAFRRMASLLHDRVDEIGQEYNNGMGRSDDPIRLLSPSARAAYYRIQGLQPPREDQQQAAPGAAPSASPGPGQAGSGDAAPNAPAPPAPDPHFAQNLSSAQPGSYERFQRLEEYHNARQRGGMAVSAIGLGDTPEDQWQDSYGITEPQAQEFEREYQSQLAHWTQARQIAGQLDAQNGGQAGYGQRAREGFTQGLNDEISGGAYALGNAIQAPFAGNFDPAGSYQTGRDAERIRDANAQDATGAPGTALEIGTSIIGSLPAFAVSGPAEAASMGGRMASGARVGGAAGAGAGWAHGEGLEDSVRGTFTGAVGGAALGTAAPAVGATARAGGRAVRGVYRTVMGENPDLSRRIVAKAIEADGANGMNPVARVSGQMADAHANDVPAMLADTGDNARGLLAASARAPGAARTAARDALDARQAGMAERVTNTIERDLGPVSNPHEVADQLMTQARDTAQPLYDSAYAAPGADTFAQRVAPLLARPSMQRALQRASRIAQEEGRDPTTAGFEINSSGEVTVSRTPSWQTLDYVKRGMDDVIEGYRDPTSGRLNLDTEGRAINNTQRSFLSAFDLANPDYAAARSAYAGPVRGIDAMNQGRLALNMTADDLEARMRDMTLYERQLFQLGTRRAMAELVASKGDSADVVHALVGTGKKRAMLARLFGSRQQFQRFVDTLGHEQEAFRTFRTARLGSPTAANLQDDSALRDAATEGATDLVLNGGTGILPAALKFVTRLGHRRLDDHTAQEVTALLSESDPARLRELASELRKEQTRQAVLSARRARNARVGGVAAGETVGNRRR